jgi:hypothetical protein
LYVEANEPSLENRRIKLGMQYATKLKAYPSHPAYECVFNPLFENVYDKQPNTIQPFGLTQYEKSETSPLLIQQHFADIRSVTSEYSAIYTDGSKDGDRVVSAAVFRTAGLFCSITICQFDLQCRG